MADKSQGKKAVEAHDSALEKALRRYKDSWDYQASHWHDKWDRDKKLYNNERVHAQYHGVTDTFVPMVFSTVETMVAALNNANIRIDYKSNDPLRQTSTAPLNALVDEWADDDQWDLAMEEGYREFLNVGMASFMYSWEMDHPHLDHFSIRDAIVDPTIKNPAQLQKPGSYAGRRYLVRKGVLDEYEVMDTKEGSKTYGEPIKRYNIPKDAQGSNAPTDEDDDKTHQELMYGSTIPNSRDQDEIIEIWDVDRVVTILNRKFIIEDVVNPYKERHETLLKQQYTEQGVEDPETKAKSDAKGLVPFFYFRNYRDVSLFYAKSEVDAIAKPQELLNDFTNMESDAILRQLAPQKELDPKYADWLDLIDNDPDTVYPFPPGTLVDRMPIQVPANSFNNRLNIKNEMREATAIDQLAKGVQNTADTTATEVREQSRQTSARIESKARILEKDGLYWQAYIVFRIFQLYVTEKIVVEVKGEDAQDLETVFTTKDGRQIQLPNGAAILDPAAYQGQWRPKIVLEVDAASRKEEEERTARENYQIIIADPTNNLAEAKKIVYPKMFSDLTKDEIDLIITPDPEAAQIDPATGEPIVEGQQDPALMAEGAPMAEQPVEAPIEAPTEEGDIDLETLQTTLTPEEIQLLESELSRGTIGR